MSGRIISIELYCTIGRIYLRMIMSGRIISIKLYCTLGGIYLRMIMSGRISSQVFRLVVQHNHILGWIQILRLVVIDFLSTQ